MIEDIPAMIPKAFLKIFSILDFSIHDETPLFIPNVKSKID